MTGTRRPTHTHTDWDCDNCGAVYAPYAGRDATGLDGNLCLACADLPLFERIYDFDREVAS